MPWLHGKEADPVGTVRQFIKNHGVVRNHVKVARGQWLPLYRVVWEKHHGPISKGCLIMHKNGDDLDDRIDNLEMISRSEHMKRLNNLPVRHKNLRYLSSKACTDHWARWRRENQKYDDMGIPIGMKVYPIPLYERMDKGAA
ncbi:MAG: HNH endonuclease [Candidatus Marinimicrobia bacterium]|nr:HNH endonuclease [Candidatus Neomarinimicrobiota bacterium]